VNGSSSRTSAGAWISARAIAARCAWPRESAPARRSASAASPSLAICSAARWRGASTPYSRAENTRFSRTVRLGESSVAWPR
jgi:hypothetical protein